MEDTDNTAKKMQFEREFMNTRLEINIVGKTFNYAKSAANDAFNLVERIENVLSMYIETSDVGLINSGKIGDRFKILDYTLECLEIAAKVYQDTLGAVDVCMGQFFTNSKGQTKVENPTRLNLGIDATNYEVEKLSEGSLDFGSLGKGYAVDKIAELFKDVWGIDNALINFGSSTIFAIGKNENGEDWEITFNGKDTGFRLKDSYALASSSLLAQATHIIDPMSLNTPKGDNACYYAHLKGSAAYADALSTAFLILSEDDIKEICQTLSVEYYKY
ncbi:MAG: FAD:protein FMN transferase [Opitutales bacterium]